MAAGYKEDFGAPIPGITSLPVQPDVTGGLITGRNPEAEEAIKAATEQVAVDPASVQTLPFSLLGRYLDPLRSITGSNTGDIVGAAGHAASAAATAGATDAPVLTDTPAPATAAPAMPRVRIPKARMVKVGETKQKQTTTRGGVDGCDPKLDELTEKANTSRANLAAAQGDNYAAEARMRNAHADAYEQSAQRDYQANLTEAAEKQRRLDELNSAEMEATKQAVNPDRYWSSLGTGKKVALGIASIFGGMLEGLGGAKNNIPDLISAAIDRDIKVQESNLRRGAAGRKAQMGIYGKYVALGMDKERARSMARATMLGANAQRLKALAARSNNGTVKQAADVAGALLERANLLEKEKLSQSRSVSTETQVEQMKRVQPRPIGGGISAKLGFKPKQKDEIKASDAFAGNVMGAFAALVSQKRFDPAGEISASLGDFLGQKGWTTSRSNAQGALQGLVQQITKKYSGAGASDPEFKRNWKHVPKLSDSAPVVINKLKLIMAPVARGMAKNAELADSPAQKRYYLREAARYRQMFSTMKRAMIHAKKKGR